MEIPEIPLEAKAMIGKEAKPQTYEVDKRLIKHFAQAIGDTNPLYYDEEYAKKTKWKGIIAPPLFVFAFAYEEPAATHLKEDGEPNNPELDVPLPTTRVMGGSGEWTLVEPIRPGDTITVKKKLVDVYNRQGKSGILYFTVVETSYINQKGKLVAREKGTFVRR